MTDAAIGRDVLRPRPPGGMGAGALLALLVHAGLIVALAFSVRWRASEPEGVEAELWAAVPQVAAPEPVRAPPPKPAPEPRPEPAPPPPPPPPPKPEPTPKAEPPNEAQIALERERLKREAEERAAREQAEREKLERDRLEREKLERKKAERDRLEREKLEREKAEREKLERERAERERREREKLERERAEREQAERERERREKAERERREAQKLAKLREENLKRMQELAGGARPSTGTAAQTAGPSASYAGRIKARVKPNIVFTETVGGNPVAVVEVRAAPDGTIVGRRLAQSSGVPAWDEAVLRAIDKTEVLPRDTDGRVPSPIEIAFRVRE
jgi:colicin import membrane protein